MKTSTKSITGAGDSLLRRLTNYTKVQMIERIDGIHANSTSVYFKVRQSNH